MNRPFDAGSLLDFYSDHLTSTLLPFWLRSVDWKDGGYFTCYDNTGSRLVSDDKYTWSQGRFLWIFAKLASMRSDLLSDSLRKEYLEIARHGAYFLMNHCLLDNSNCTFLMDKKGNWKRISPDTPYDASVFADCFVVAGLAKYAAASGDPASFEFAKNLYASILQRLQSDAFQMAPYPTPPGYKAQSIPMILLNVTQELLEAAEIFQKDYVEDLKLHLREFMDEISVHFVSHDHILHEMLGTDNRHIDTLLGRYCNPGHTNESMWFVMHAALKLGTESHMEKAALTVKKAFEIGWDSEYGGMLLFADRQGGPPKGDTTGIEDEAMVKQIRDNWDNKLWWTHSESLYAAMLCYRLTQNEQFLEFYQKVHDYTFQTFPNPDREVGEWIQIRKRHGEPIDKVVSLPVKDPYHIIRNVIYIIELLQRWPKSKP